MGGSGSEPGCAWGAGYEMEANVDGDEFHGVVCVRLFPILVFAGRRRVAIRVCGLGRGTVRCANDVSNSRYLLASA